METFEERLTALEREHTDLKHDNEELKQKMELQTIAIGGLVNKAMLERINEKNDKIFQALISHDEFTNHQLSELRERVEVQVEGKIAGLQTEMRQSFETVATKDDLSAVNARLDQIMLALAALAPKPEQGTDL